MFSSGFGYLWKKHRPHRRGLTARNDQSLSPSANCSRSRFLGAYFSILSDIIDYLDCSSAAPKRLRQQLASGTSESDELSSRQAASVWYVVFPVGTEIGKYHSKNVGSENLFF